MSVTWYMIYPGRRDYLNTNGDSYSGYRGELLARYYHIYKDTALYEVLTI